MAIHAEACFAYICYPSFHTVGLATASHCNSASPGGTYLATSVGTTVDHEAPPPPCWYTLLNIFGVRLHSECSPGSRFGTCNCRHGNISDLITNVPVRGWSPRAGIDLIRHSSATCIASRPSVLEIEFVMHGYLMLR